MVVSIAAVAACNALLVPLQLERQIFLHPRTAPILAAHSAGVFEEGAKIFGTGLEGQVLGMRQVFEGMGCDNLSLLQRCVHIAHLPHYLAVTYRFPFLGVT